jgi:hypothetical protein
MKWSGSLMPSILAIKQIMRLIILTFAIILSHQLHGQSENRFRNFHGIKHPQNNVSFFEAEGYDIFIQQVDNGLDEKGLSKIRKKYSIKNGPLATDSALNVKVLSREEQQGGINVYYTYYLLSEAEKKTNVIGFVKAKVRDIELERIFVSSYLSNQIPSFIYTGLETDSIDFVGRTIKLGQLCRWMSPHNIQCPNYGQMNWALFDKLEQAEDYRDTHFAMTKNKNLVDIKEEKWVNVRFEGQETKALQTKIKVQLPKLVMGGSNILVVYYITEQVRGRYVACVLSHYTDDVGADKLPALLREVMELKE